ncbi:MAG: hypothetical protein ACYTBP_16550 [Planctomycetota bacterium]|jgi:hypothetical protein
MPFDKGPLSVHVRVDKGTITIAETVNLELEATIEHGYEIKMPKVAEILSDFGIVDWDNPGDRLDENNKVVKTRRYRLEPFLSGTYQMPAFTFEFYDANSPEENKYELVTEPVDIEVTSLLGDQRAELVIADIEEVVVMPKQRIYLWLWVMIAVLLCLSGAAGWLYLSKKKNLEFIRIFRPAHEIAYDRLRALIKDDLINAGRIKEFYEWISNILRHYIEHRFDLRAPERTTEEFLYELQNTNVLGESDKKSIGEFLTHCDLVKFAKHNPTTEQIQRTFDLVKEFIEKTKTDERKVDVTNSVTETENVVIENA